jgi:putative transposase
MTDATVQNSLAEVWRVEATAWLVGYYLLMPDHMHFFCAPRDLRFEIDQWVKFWKSKFSQRHLNQPWSWQLNSFHRRMRNRIEYEEKLAYVRENPLRKSLVSRPEEWPYQGRIHDIWWTAD